MQTSFTKAIVSTDNKIYVFHFSLLYTVDCIADHVLCKSNLHLNHYFILEKLNGKWEFTDSYALPDWITELESKLHNAIEESLK